MLTDFLHREARPNTKTNKLMKKKIYYAHNRWNLIHVEIVSLYFWEFAHLPGQQEHNRRPSKE